MSDKETFEEWFDKKNWWSIEAMKREFQPEYYCRTAWFYQQTKIDQLEADNKILNGVIEKAERVYKTDSTGMYVNGVFLTYKQAVIILSHYYKEKLKERGE